MANLQLEVVTPERAVLREEVDDVVLPGALGQMDVLPGHLPLLTILEVGPMTIRQDGDERVFLIDRGYAEVADDKVTVLTEGCDGVNDIDIDQAREVMKALEEKIEELEAVSKTEEVEEELFEQHRLSLERERMRLAFAEEQAGEK